MKKFKVTITESLEKVVEVKAPSLVDAELLVESQWKAGDHILDSSNFTGIEFNAEEVQRQRGMER